MAEEEVVAAAAAAAAVSPGPSDHKRKHEDLEPGAPEQLAVDSNANAKENESVSVRDEEDKEAVGDAVSEESEAKRPRLDEKSDGLVGNENGFQEEKVDEPVEDGEPCPENNTESEDTQLSAKSDPETVNNELPSTDDHQAGDGQPPSVENYQLESAQEKPTGEELQEPSAEAPQQGDVSYVEQQIASETQSMSRKMEVPNNKVGVLIGKGGDTIKFLQLNSGAKIQITRDADADPRSATRLVELIGTLESIAKAEKLIKDVIAEADAGGSPSLVARGFSTVQAAGAAEQILIQVPNEKVGLIIGKGGDTIKNLQTRSGARIQLIPQHLPEGDQSKERTVRVSGDKKQIEMAREMINEVMNQPVRPSPLSGGYNQQQGFRPRGTAAAPQWGSRGYPPTQSTGYDYQQRGPYPSQNSQYPPQAYGSYPHQVTPRSSFSAGWEQRPPTMQGPPQQSGGYDYYGGPGHMVEAPTSVPISNPAPGPSPTPMGLPHSQGNYNYGQPAPYSQAAPPQSYGHGYNEAARYESQAPSHHPYGGHVGSQPGGYPQGTHPGYPPQDQYGKAPSYGMPPQAPPSQHYAQPRPSQPGDMPYQAPISSGQPYGHNAPPQQTYPYVSSGPMQQTYPPYGSQSANDGYNQMQPATGSAPAYPQQGGQPASGYGQPGGQQAVGYGQAAPTGGYGSYPSSQPGYSEQPTQNNAGYGYQGAAESAYGSAPGSAYGAPTVHANYAQPAPTQPGYDQSVPQTGSYGSFPGPAPVGYGKSLSPQPGYPPQYDSSQMYGAHR